MLGGKRTFAHTEKENKNGFGVDNCKWVQKGEPMTYIEYILTHEEERREADGCQGCAHEVQKPWVYPCKKCKRNMMDLYETREEFYNIFKEFERKESR